MADLDKLIAAIDRAEENAYGDDGELSAERAYSIQLYLGQNVDPAPDGRSQVTDRSVFETIQWILPSLCRIFANGNDLVSIPPIGPDDEAGAKQEEEYLNWVIGQQSPWFETFLSWATDALMIRNAYALAYVDRERQVEVERYERQTREGVAMLTQDKDVEVLELNEYPDEESPPEPVMDPMTGQPALDEMGQPVTQPVMLYDVSLRRVGEKRKICIKVLPPERCKVSQYATSFRVADVPYFEYWDMKPLSDLRSMGFDVPDDIASDEDPETEEDAVRDLYAETRDDDRADPSMRRVKVRMVWIRHDYDEDGIAELQYVLRVGREILHREEINTIPVASLVPSPLPHRHYGLSITDMVADIQRIKTAILRQGLDNLYLSNNPQKVVNKNMVDLDDLISSIPGGIIKTDDVNAVRYEKHPFIFAEAMAGMEYMDSVRENRAGVNRYFSGTDQNALNKTATGIQTLSTMAAQRVEQIARVFGSGIEDLARIVHELILKNGHKKEVVKIRGQWVEVDPASWRHRTDFRIAVGFAAGNKDAMVARLMMIAQNQQMALQMGLPVVQPQNYYQTMLELTKASDFSSPERFWTDPEQVEPQQAPPDPNMMKLQGDMAAKQAELEIKQEESAADRALREQELALKAAEAERQLELEKYKIDKQAETQLLLAQLSAQQQAELVDRQAAYESAEKDKDRASKEPDPDSDGVKKAVSEVKDKISLAKMVDSLTQAVEQLNRPRKVIRDKQGRIGGVE